MRPAKRKRARARLAEMEADADERLAEARAMKASTEERGPVVDAIAAEAARLARRNRIAEIVYRGLMNGGHA
jgi:hypothetical protein